MCEQYNGKVNYPTDAVTQWYWNDAFSYDLVTVHLPVQAIEKTIRDFKDYWYDDFAWGPRLNHNLAGIIKEEVESKTPEIENGLHLDLMQWAIDRVDYYELADLFLGDFMERHNLDTLNPEIAERIINGEL